MKIDKEKIFNKYKGHCAYCGIKLKNIRKMHIEHYIPKHRGGTDDPENINPSCHKCNRHKGGYMPEEWRAVLKKQVSLLRKNATFDRALKFRQIYINKKAIIFYFEKKKSPTSN